MRFQTENGVLIAQANGETLRIEPWGKDSLRVRATMLPGFFGKDWALTEVPEKTEAKAEQFEVDHLEIDGSMGKRTSASITNGKIRGRAAARASRTNWPKSWAMTPASA